MVARNPNGIHFQNIEYPGPQWVIDTCRAGAYTTVTMLDDHKLAGRIQAEAGVPYTIARLSKFEPYPGDNASDQQIADYALSIYTSVENVVREAGNRNIHVMINCEQGKPNRPRLLMYTELMKLSASDPEGSVGMVFCNASSGAIESGFWGNPNDWKKPEFQFYLLTMHKYRKTRLKSGSYAFVHGSHPYTNMYPWAAVNAGQHRVPSWEEGNKFTTGEYYISGNLAQDHLGREQQGQFLALGYRFNASTRKWEPGPDTLRDDKGYIEPPWYINTECWVDDMPDLRKAIPPDLTVDHGGTFPKGWRSLATWWKKRFGDASAGVTHARMHAWTYDVVDGPLGYCIGSNLFCAGDTGPWDMDNLTPGGTPDKDFWEVNMSFRRNVPEHFFSASVAQPPGPTNPPPIPIPPTPTEIFSPGEKVVVQNLAAALESFLNLKGISAANAATFTTSVQSAMNVIMSQPTIRALQSKAQVQSATDQD